MRLVVSGVKLLRIVLPYEGWLLLVIVDRTSVYSGGLLIATFRILLRGELEVFPSIRRSVDTVIIIIPLFQSKIKI